MRLPINEKENDLKIVKILNTINNDLRSNFENAIKTLLETVKVKVMLADFTVIDTNTFDPNRVLNYFFSKEKEIESLKNWDIVPVQLTKTDDLHRIFFQLSLDVAKYHFYIYMGIQFHALLFYKIDKDIININRKIKQLEEENEKLKSEISIQGNQIIKQELDSLGYKEIANMDLFEELFSNQNLSENLNKKANEIENSFPQLTQNTELINTLKKDLDNFTIETYQINKASIDSNKLMLGEEGIAFNMDIEMTKNKKNRERTSVIDFNKIEEKDLNKILDLFYKLIDIFKK
ncbi:MAG: hypothetical protein ACTHJ7_08240, partial [Candidatus Nitrosocosmicus sp.]